MFHEINWIPIYGSIWIDPYISRFSVDYKRQEGSTTDYNNSYQCLWKKRLSHFVPIRKNGPQMLGC